MDQEPRRLEPFAQVHVDECATLYASVFREPPWREAWTEDAACRRLADMVDTPGFLGVVCLDGRGPCGFAVGHRLQGPESGSFYLYDLCVKRDVRRRGVGSDLLRSLHRELAGTDVGRVVLLTARGGLAEAFYAKNGYRRDEDVVLMAREASATEGAAKGAAERGGDGRAPEAR